MKPACNKRNDEMRQYVCQLYSEGKSVKDIGKIIGRNHSLAYKWVKQAGMLDKNRGGYMPESHLRKALKRETLSALVYDESNHWANHSAVNSWRSIRSYYRNHESRKAISREKAKVYYHANKADPERRRRRNAQMSAYFKANPHIRQKYRDRIKRENPDIILKWRRTARNKPKNKITNNLRRRLRDLMHGRVGMGSSELTGCSRAFLVMWIEKQFKRGMSWSNYGHAWHVDHIVPCAAFCLSDREEAKRCFHYSNLRPLWARDNMDKADKIIQCQPELLIAI